MKRLIFYFLFLTTFLAMTRGQKNAFVLIDVSGNPQGYGQQARVTYEMRKDAEDLVKQLIEGKYDKARFSKNWMLSGNTDPIIKDIVEGKGQSLLEKNGHLLMMPFGAKNTYLNFIIQQISLLPQDLNQYWDSPSSYSDQNTFGEIAKAKAADAALDADINEYYLFMIYGLGEDTGSQLYTDEEREYLDNYNSGVVRNSLALFRHRDANKDFKIEVSHIDLKKIASNSTRKPGLVKPPNVPRPTLSIVTPKGTRNKPFKLKKDQLLVSWTCLGCDPDTEFTIRLSSLDKRNPGQTYKAKGRYNYRIQLAGDGDYKVTVSGGSGLTASQYFKFNSGGGGSFFIILLILMALAGAGYWVYKQFFANKTPGGTSMPNDEDDFGYASRKDKTSGGESFGDDDAFGSSSDDNSGAGYF